MHVILSPVSTHSVSPIFLSFSHPCNLLLCLIIPLPLSPPIPSLYLSLLIQLDGLQAFSTCLCFSLTSIFLSPMHPTTLPSLLYCRNKGDIGKYMRNSVCTKNSYSLCCKRNSNFELSQTNEIIGRKLQENPNKNEENM